MIKFDVLNRYSGDIQFTAEIDCKDSETNSIKLGLSVAWAIKTKANLREANLRWADLRWADLRWANLSGANLRWANLSGANNFVLLPVADYRGYSFTHAIKCKDEEWRIRAGCRFFTIDEAVEHWGDSYHGPRDIGDQYLYAVEFLKKHITKDSENGN